MTLPERPGKLRARCVGNGSAGRAARSILAAMLRRPGLGLACPLLVLATAVAAVAVAEAPEPRPAGGAPTVVSPEAEAASPSPALGFDREEFRRKQAAHQAERAERQRQRARRQSELQFRTLSLARAGIAVTGFSLYGWGLWRRRRGRGGDRVEAVRQGLLALVAVSAFPAYYNFFQAHHPGGFKGADVYHYYMGSRYFEELGYFDLYPCTLAALEQDGLQDPATFPPVRDQRSLRLQSPEQTRREMQACPERFSPVRWESFRRDVRFFRPRILGGSWKHLLEDHGYNPSPVWSFVGGVVSGNVLPTADSLPSLIAIDRVLVVLMAVAIAWAFGLEAACLAAIVWGTSPLWSYNWTGDAFLRNLWLAAAVLGWCLLERRRHLAAGLGLATAALLRLFPAIFAVGPALQAAVSLRRGALSPGALRLLAGLAVGGAVLLAAGAFGTGRGPSAYLEFREKMAAVVAQPGANKVGLSALATEWRYRAERLELTTPEGREITVSEPAPFAVAAIRGGQLLLALLAVAAYLRGVLRASPVEASLLGFAVIPFLTSPANYYHVFVVAGALLAVSRPWVGVALCACAFGWIVCDQALFLSDARYLAWDGVSLVFSLAVLIGMALGSARAAPDASAASATP